MRGKLSATQIMDYTSQINTRAEQMAQAWRRVKIEGGNYEHRNNPVAPIRFVTRTTQKYFHFPTSFLRHRAAGTETPGA